MDEKDIAELLRIFLEHAGYQVLTDEEDQLKGYDLAVDEYVAKPFSVSVLLKKIEAILCRSRGERIVASYKEIVMDKDEHLLKVDGKEVSLTSREFDILYLFASQPHRLITKEFLLDRVWKYEYCENEQVINMIKRSLSIKVFLIMDAVLIFNKLLLLFYISSASLRSMSSSAREPSQQVLI